MCYIYQTYEKLLAKLDNIVKLQGCENFEKEYSYLLVTKPNAQQTLIPTNDKISVKYLKSRFLCASDLVLLIWSRGEREEIERKRERLTNGTKTMVKQSSCGWFTMQRKRIAIRTTTMPAVVVGSDMRKRKKLETKLRNFVKEKKLHNHVHFVNKTLNVATKVTGIIGKD